MICSILIKENSAAIGLQLLGQNYFLMQDRNIFEWKMFYYNCVSLTMQIVFYSIFHFLFYFAYWDIFSVSAVICDVVSFKI